MRSAGDDRRAIMGAMARTAMIDDLIASACPQMLDNHI